MTLAYAIPPLWMILAAVYMLLAVPLVGILSALLFFRVGPIGRLTTAGFPAGTLPFAVLNLALTLYFFFGTAELGEILTPIDWAWLAAVVCSPAMLLLCILRAGESKRGGSPDDGT